MTEVKESKRTNLSKEQKLRLLADWEKNDNDMGFVCKKYGISERTFYNIKTKLYGLYLEKTTNGKALKTIGGTVPVVFRQNFDAEKTEVVQKRTLDALGRVIDVANMKMDREIKRIENSNHDDSIKNIDVLSLGELSNFWKALAPYVLPEIAPGQNNDDNTTIGQKRQYILNLIQNQQIVNKNGNENEKN